MAELDSLQTGGQCGGGRFTLIRILGRGGMGVVWLAHDERLNEQVALKFLPLEVRENAPMLEHLRQETARSHRLTHPNIVRLHDFHEPPGEPAFIAMEYVEGASLNALRAARPNGVYPWDHLRRLLLDLCEALEYAHGEFVIHRDLKPDNLLVDNRGRLKLTDFGLATMASELGAAGGGTLHYMSPQQLQGKHPQFTDDIYSLGATLYELLTSQAPFTSGDIAAQIINDIPQSPKERLASLGIENPIPSEVSAMIMSCLAKDPTQRPQNIQAVTFWLEPQGPGFPTTSKRPSSLATPPPERVHFWKILSVAMIAVFVALGWYFKWKENRKPAASAVPARVFPGRARWTNSLDMVFVPVPDCEALLCIWKTRVQDYQTMVDSTKRRWDKPSFQQAPDHPAVNIRWQDAEAFCDWLTDRERAAGFIGTNQYYRLPLDAEWSWAVGLEGEIGSTPKEKDGKTPGVYPWGTEWPPPNGSGNFDQKLKVDDYPNTSPVGAFKPNAYGLFDMAGNAREWCEDLYAPGMQRRVVRGSSWFDTPKATLESARRALTPADRHEDRYDYFGFRCALVVGESRPQ